MKNLTQLRRDIRAKQKRSIKYRPVGQRDGKLIVVKEGLPAPPRRAPAKPILPVSAPVMVRLVRPAVTEPHNKVLYKGAIGRVLDMAGGKWVVWFPGAVVGVAPDSDFIEVVK